MESEITSRPLRIFGDRVLNSMVLGHFIVDFLNGQRSLVLAMLSMMLGLSNYGLGVLTMVYVVSSAAAQPIFGYISDKYGARWVASGGVLLMGVFYTLALFLHGWASVAFLIIASIGSGAFHPAGAMEATIAGQERMKGREATAASLFFLFGQMGFGIGPMIGGPLLSHFGLPGLLILTVFTFPIGGFAYRELKQLPRRVYSKVEKLEEKSKFKFTRYFWLMVGIAAFQAWSQSNITAYMTRYLAEMQISPSIYGVIIGLFTAGSAIGCMVGGELADRIGRKQVIAGSLLISTIPLGLIALTGYSLWLYPLMFLAGGFTGGSYSVIVVQAQRVIPTGKGLASGLAMCFIFSSGAIGLVFSGMMADQLGYQSVFIFTTLLAMAGGALGLLLNTETAASA